MTDTTPTNLISHVKESDAVKMIHNDVTINAVGKTVPIFIGDATQVTLLISIGGETGAGTILFKINVIESVSGDTIKTYDGTSLSAIGTDYIFIDSLTLGDYITVEWTAGAGTLNGANYFTNVTSRLIVK